MQIKTCPECGVENESTSALCSACHTSLENVPISEKQEASRSEEMSPDVSYSERSAPVKQGPNWAAIVLLAIVLASGAFAGWWFCLRVPGPAEVVQQFVDAKKNREVETMKACLSESTLNMLGSVPDGDKYLTRDTGDISLQIIKTSFEGDNAIVEIEPANKANLPPGMANAEIVLVSEEKQWKIDLPQTMQRMMSKMFKNGFPKGFGKHGLGK